MMADLRIKVCGMTDRKNVELISRLNPDYMGFIFYPKSVRYVGKNPDPGLFREVPGSTARTAVFVNEYYERILEITNRYGIEVVQLHGMESPETCKSLKLHGKTVIKVFPGDQLSNIQQMESYDSSADYFLFDTPVMTKGGSGRKFDWSNLDELHSGKKFFLSGGISVEDADRILALNYKNFWGIDINSRFETEPGIKDFQLVAEFIKKIRNGHKTEIQRQQ